MILYRICTIQATISILGNQNARKERFTTKQASQQLAIMLLMLMSSSRLVNCHNNTNNKITCSECYSK